MLKKAFESLIGVYSGQSPLRKRIESNFAWSLFGTSFLNLSGLLISVFLARFLGQSTFGELGMINSTLAMFSVFAALGIGLTATKFIAEFREIDRLKAGRIIGLSNIVSLISGLLASTALFLLAPFISRAFLNAPQLEYSFRLVSVILLFNAFNGSLTGALAGLEAFKQTAAVNIAMGLANLPLFVIGAKYGGLTGVLKIMLCTSLAALLLNYLLLQRLASRKGLSVSYSGLKPEMQILWQFSLPALLSSALVMPVMWAAQTFLVNRPGGYAEMGLFNAAHQWRTFFLIIPNIIYQATTPIAANLYGNKNYASHAKVIFYNLIVIGSVSLAFFGIIAIFSQKIMSFYGPGFANASNALLFIALAAILQSSIGVVGQFMISASKIWDGFILNLLWAAVLLASSFFLTPKGANGLALAYLVSYGFHLLTVSCYTFLLKKKEFFGNDGA